MGSFCGGMTTYNIDIWVVCQVLVLVPRVYYTFYNLKLTMMIYTCVYVKSKRKTQLGAITK